MKLQNIERNYGLYFKFFQKHRGDEKKYNELFQCQEYQKTKEITIPYYEELLHIIYSYSTLFKWVIPIQIIFFSLSTKWVLIPGILILISILSFLYLKNRWKIICRRYQFEMLSNDYYINQKYNTNICTDLNLNGIEYLQGKYKS
jgi:hypothetical protein